ncbi:MAG: putative porin [Elusimicrobiota bacterium]
MKKLVSFFIIVVYSACLNSSEIDILLDKLVEKGVISGYEASEVKYEGSEQTVFEITNRLHKTLPLWLQSISLGGDIRIRHEEIDNDDVSYIRSRERIRARAYLNAKASDKVYANIGFATGEDDNPKSTNQTFTKNFSKKGVYLDYAYFEYYPFSFLTFLAGKMKNPLWMTNDMIFDGDINPEGYFLKAEKAFNSNFSLFLGAGRFNLNEIKDNSNDPYLLFSQTYLKLRDEENFKKLKFAFSFYDFKDVKNSKLLDYATKTNSTPLPSTTTYKYDYDVISLDLLLESNIQNNIKIPFTPLSINYIAINANYVKNILIKKDNEGYIIGVKIGNEKITNSGEFQIGYNYRELKKDAWVDCYPDSDFYGGKTQVYGSKYTFIYGLGENFNLTSSYFLTRSFKTSDKKEEVFQVDLNVKF